MQRWQEYSQALRVTWRTPKETDLSVRRRVLRGEQLLQVFRGASRHLEQDAVMPAQRQVLRTGCLPKVRRHRSCAADWRTCLGDPVSRKGPVGRFGAETRARVGASARPATTNAERTAMHEPLLFHCMADGDSARRCSSRLFDNAMCRCRSSIGCGHSRTALSAYTIGRP